MSPQELEDRVDWAVVEKALADKEELPVYEEEVLDALVKKTLPQICKDLDELSNVHVEEGFLYELEGVKHKGYSDIVALRSSDPDDGYACYNPLIVDWKVRVGTISENWRRRHEPAEQIDFYLFSLLETGVLEPSSEPFFGEIRMIPTEGLVDKIQVTRTLEYLLAYGQQAKKWRAVALSQLAYGLNEPWARNMPDGCFKYGPRYGCDFLKICKGQREQPTVDPSLADQMNFSFTLQQEFRRCPERARLITIGKFNKELDEVPSLAPSLGSAFHTVVAEIYKQVI